MSHKQAKKVRKGHPHLHPNWKREKRRMFNEALTKAATAQQKPAEAAAQPTAVKPRRADAKLAAAGLLALAAGLGGR